MITHKIRSVYNTMNNAFLFDKNLYLSFYLFIYQKTALALYINLF